VVIVVLDSMHQGDLESIFTPAVLPDHRDQGLDSESLVDSSRQTEENLVGVMWSDIQPEKLLEIEHPYVEFARRAFEGFVAPWLKALLNNDTFVFRRPTVDYCFPGATQHNYRLFPGSLFLLLRQCIFPSSAPDDGDYQTAAAIELAHNSTLIHDDNIDHHEVRGGRPTLLAEFGTGPSLLYGNIAILLSTSALLSSDQPKTLSRLRILHVALEQCCWGQLQDEPALWKSVAPESWLSHWEEVCRLKLRVGDVAAYMLAAELAEERFDALPELLSRFSPVSQIINDFNVLSGRYGYHVTSPDGRAVGEESEQKPTLPHILCAEIKGFRHGKDWTKYHLGGDEQIKFAVYHRAQEMLQQRKESAFQTLKDLGLPASAWLEILWNFFTAPSLD
jgi:geranylgeranyl pyrophosphate synthase